MAASSGLARARHSAVGPKGRVAVGSEAWTVDQPRAAASGLGRKAFAGASPNRGSRAASGGASSRKALAVAVAAEPSGYPRKLSRASASSPNIGRNPEEPSPKGRRGGGVVKDTRRVHDPELDAFLAGDDEDGDDAMSSAAVTAADGFSATGRHLALGGQPSAPRHFADGDRWVGGQTSEMNAALIRQCTVESDAGKIVELNFHYKFIQEIRGLEPSAPHLRTLTLSSNNIREISGLGGMMKLKELKLYGCQISRIQGLEQCPSLAALHLEDNRISVVEGLDGTRSSLEFLNLDRNRIHRLGRGLSRLTKLKELHVARNQLDSLEGLAGLGTLEQLDASHNKIREVSAEHLKGLTKLDELILAGNVIPRLDFLAGGAHGTLPSLSTLDVSGNQISCKALKTSPALPLLCELNLAENGLEEVPETATRCWPCLEILDLSGNRLSQQEDLSRLKALPLKELLLQGNPIAAQPLDLRRALSAISSLEYVDDRPLESLPALEDDIKVEDLDTFHLTVSRLPARPGSSGSRPGTGLAGTMSGGSLSSTSRPGTGGASRPGTAQALKEAGVKDPLMHSRVKLSDRRFATEEQANNWEQNTLSGLSAIQKQIERTVSSTEAELREMNMFLQKAERVLRRESQLQAAGNGSGRPLESVPEKEEQEEPRPVATPESSCARRLREACRQNVDVARSPSPDPAPSNRSSHAHWPKRRPTLNAAVCDEEIDEDVSDAVGIGSEAEIPPEIDDEEDDAADGESSGRPVGNAISTVAPGVARGIRRSSSRGSSRGAGSRRDLAAACGAREAAKLRTPPRAGSGVLPPRPPT